MATERQKKAMDNIVENGGNVSKAMIAAGYSPATAKTPQKLTQSEAFQQYMIAAGITGEKLATVLKQGLDATRIVTSPTEPDSEVADFQTRHKYLETALKVSGVHNQGDVNVNFFAIAKDERGIYDA